MEGIIYLLVDWHGLFTFDTFKGRVLVDSSHGALTAWKLTYEQGSVEVRIVEKYVGEDCKDAINRSGKKHTNCPCTECYKYKASYPKFKFVASLNEEASWIKNEFRDDATLLKHEQIHLRIVEKIAEQESLKMRTIWKEGQKNCDDGWAKYSAKIAIRQSLNESLNAVVDTITKEQDRYDTETSHGEVSEMQDEWNKKYE